jgi:hypothetical protein
VDITRFPKSLLCAAILPELSFVAHVIRKTPHIARITENVLSRRNRSPRIQIENAYAKKALQLYIAVTSDVDVRATARNHVLAAIVSVTVSVAMTQNIYLTGERRVLLANGDSENT